MTKPLILGIGMNKTGTRSLADALTILGFPCLHAARYIKQVVSTNGDNGRLPLDGLTDTYTAFCDSPINSLFKELDVAYPGSRFIFTVRREEPWLKSRIAQFGKTPEEHLAKLHTHLNDVKSYFAARDTDVLTYHLCDGEGWTPLCHFLGVSVPSRPFPWRNKKLRVRRVKFRIK